MLIKKEEDGQGFEALSYAWGSVDNPSQVQIQSDGNRHLTITRNLDIALRYLRFSDEPREIWVDALCIDQYSIEEKNHQVALMGEIYGLADNVMIWLGPEENKSNEALALMTSICQEVEADWNTDGLRPSKTCTNEDWANYYVPLPYMAGELIPVTALFERPYFSRAWIRQEVVRATAATIYCGSIQMAWADFRTAAVCLRAKTCNPEAIGLDRWPAFSRARIEVYNLCRLLRRQFNFSTLPFSKARHFARILAIVSIRI